MPATSKLSDAAIAGLREIVKRPASDSRYEIGEQIGEGGMGAVYLAHDRELNRDVALKVLRAPIPTDDERMRILREARILASLEHPGIVPVHDVGALPDGRLFYVMKRVRGELHRDLKPQNIMLGAFGEVLVLDWGVAKSRVHVLLPVEQGETLRPADGPITVSGTAAGTPGYMAPEQLRGAADERVDVFGLGGILFFLLTREHPTLTEGRWNDARGVPAPLRAICERARALDPASRYQSVTTIAADVANYLDALPVTAHTEGVIERLRRVAVRHRTALLLVLAYLVMRVALLIFARR